MKRLLAYLFIVLGLGLVVSVKADDIRDFQIEGMSIGDSLLDYYSDEEIKSRISRDYPSSDKYKRFYSWKHKSFEIYEGVQVNFMKNDKKYIIKGIAGEIKYSKNIDDCYKLMSDIENEIYKMFPNIKKYSYNNEPKEIDPSGASTVSGSNWIFPSGDGIGITCTDYSKGFENIKRFNKRKILNNYLNCYNNILKNKSLL